MSTEEEEVDEPPVFTPRPLTNLQTGYASTHPVVIPHTNQHHCHWRFMRVHVYSGSSSFLLRNRDAMLWSVSRDGPCHQLPQLTLGARMHCYTPWFTRSLSLRCLWCQRWNFWEKVNLMSLLLVYCVLCWSLISVYYLCLLIVFIVSFCLRMYPVYVS